MYFVNEGKLTNHSTGVGMEHSDGCKENLNRGFAFWRLLLPLRRGVTQVKQMVGALCFYWNGTLGGRRLDQTWRAHAIYDLGPFEVRL